MPRVRRSFTGAALLTCLALAGCGARSGPDHAAWRMELEDGKTGDIACGDLWCRDFGADYQAMLRRLSYWNVEAAGSEAAMAEARALAPPALRIVEIGRWHDWTVIDATNIDLRHKAILLRDAAGRMRPLYAQTKWADIDLAAQPTIRDLGSFSILSYRARISGTGHFFVELHYVLDADSGVPVPVDLSPIDAAIRANVPPEHGVWKGGGLDFFALTYAAAVWKQGDGNCCPTGGSIAMRLAFDGQRLSVADVRYDPTSLR